VLGLNETQESSLDLMFRWADQADQAGLLLDLKDPRPVIGHLTSDAGKPELRVSARVSTATSSSTRRHCSSPTLPTPFSRRSPLRFA